MKRILTFVILIAITHCVFSQTEAPSWIDYADKKESNKLNEAILSDYSYSGYHFSEKEIPDVSTWAKFDVTIYGATPNDDQFDDDGIRAAINAAIDSEQPAVVYFPAGKFLVSDGANANKPFIINASNIVLKGAGSGDGGTEIYADKTIDNPSDASGYPWRFHFKADNAASDEKITSINHRINRGDFTVEVQDAGNLSVGQVVNLYHGGVENLEANMPGLNYKAEWIRIINNGIRTHEKHIVESIEGNKVTFTNPVQYNMTADVSGAELRKCYTIEEVGIEDILFTSGWANSEEEYAHHASDFVDYAYRALAFENVKNGWIRNCEIKHWNESLMIEKSIGVTVDNILISGKQGHTSYFARYSYGILFKNCEDIVPVGFKNAGGQGHGPGMRWSTVNTVFHNCKMKKHQSIDCHGYHPYSNLLDNVSGGSFYGNGGTESAYPNSGPYLTFWNFLHDAHYSNWTFDFWNTETRKTHVYVNPLFVGFRVVEKAVSLKNTGLNELNGKIAYPVSLFDAQLQLRLYGAYMSASSSSSNALPVNANDGNAETNWTSKNNGAGEWLMLDLGKAESVNEVTIDETIGRINEWKLEAFINETWQLIKTGEEIGANKVISFDRIETRKLRLTLVSMKTGKESNPVSLNAFKVSGDSYYVGIPNHAKIAEDAVKIYPNPSADLVNIEVNFEGEKQVSIYNSLGKIVWQNTTQLQHMQLRKGEELNGGLYLVQVKGKYNFSVTKRIIVS